MPHIRKQRDVCSDADTTVIDTIYSNCFKGNVSHPIIEKPSRVNNLPDNGRLNNQMKDTE